jgi:DNA-binding Lrp family transcriptional regulator
MRVSSPAPKISDVDRQLLRLLQENARRTNRELAETVGIAQSTCLERIRSLTERGIIVGWRAEVDTAAIGRPVRALIHVRLQPKTSGSVREFQHQMIELPETLTVSTVAGQDDFIVEVAVADVPGLRDFVLDWITSRSDVADARTALVYDQVRNPIIHIPNADDNGLTGRSRTGSRPRPSEAPRAHSKKTRKRVVDRRGQSNPRSG